MGGWLVGIVHVSTTTNGQNNEFLIFMVISETRKRERELMTGLRQYYFFIAKKLGLEASWVH